MNQETADSTYRSCFKGREGVTTKEVPNVTEQPASAKQRYKTKSVHAKDWRRLDFHSPTYANTVFKL